MVIFMDSTWLEPNCRNYTCMACNEDRNRQICPHRTWVVWKSVKSELAYTAWYDCRYEWARQVNEIEMSDECVLFCRYSESNDLYLRLRMQHFRGRWYIIHGNWWSIYHRSFTEGNLSERHISGIFAFLLRKHRYQSGNFPRTCLTDQ